MKRMASLCLGSLLALGACGDDDGPVSFDAPPGDDTDAAAPGTPDAGQPGTPDGGGADPAARGEYLVHHVSVCIDCHTPRNKDGSLDMTRLLAGEPNFPFA